MKNILGIDPGASGGIAVRTINGRIETFNMPETDSELIKLFREVAVSPPSANVVFLEDLVRFMGSTPMAHMAVYASNWGTIKGAVLALGFKLEIIRPQAWMKYLNLGITGRIQPPKAPKGSTPTQKKIFNQLHAEEFDRVKKHNAGLKTIWKNKLKDEAKRLYPELKLNLAKADAVLIMEYGIRTTDDNLTF